MKITYTLLLVLLVCITGYSQSSTSSRALKAYNNMFYDEAAMLYQEIVDKTEGTQEELQNLADSYYKLNEYIDAELTYEKLFKKFPSQSQPVILKYAQVLAQNERYVESQKYYSMYNADSRGKIFSEAYGSLSKFFRDSSNVNIKFLPINTLQSEYSPAIYERGIVFASNRNPGSGIKRVYGRNNTPYTDLYYLQDTMILKNHWLTDQAVTVYTKNLGVRSFNDDYTPESSNDSKTIGHFDSYYQTTEEAVLEVEPFNSTINSKYNEGPVCFSKNYDTVFFTRNSYNEGKTKIGSEGVTRIQIYYATKGPNGKFGNVQSFPFNNPDYSFGHPALSPDGKRLYFVSDKKPGLGETDIYYSEIREHRFTEPVNAGPVINTPGSEMFSYFNQDGSLFFASTGHAGLGGLDIFRAEFTNNQFQNPRNLGYPINSSKDDFGICSSHSRGATGYFSSNRLRGRADDNIYSYTDSRPQNVLIKGIIKVKHVDENGKSYVEPLSDAVVTLSPFGDKVTTDRTGNFEFLVARGKLYTVEGEKEMLGKDKKEINLVNAKKDKHTYPVELLLEEQAALVPSTAKVVEAETKTPIKNAVIYLYDIESAKAEKITSDSLGNFSASLVPGHNYILKSTAEGYFSDCYKLTAVPQSNQTLNIENLNLKKIQLNTTFEVKNLLYVYNKSTIRTDAAEVLDKVVRFLKDYPEIEVELGSHTDSRGSDEYNQKLSSERANSSAAYIVSQGIDSSRITAKGYGETKPLNHCKNGANCSEEQHQQNRRTEVKVTGIKEPEPSAQAPTTAQEDLNADPNQVFKYLNDFSDCKEYKAAQ